MNIIGYVQVKAVYIPLTDALPNRGIFTDFREVQGKTLPLLKEGLSDCLCILPPSILSSHNEIGTIVIEKINIEKIVLNNIMSLKEYLKIFFNNSNVFAIEQFLNYCSISIADNNDSFI